MAANQDPSTIDAGDEPVVVTRRQLDALLALAERVDELEAGRAAPATPPTPRPRAAAATTGTGADPVRLGRRRALAGLAGAAAVGTVAALASGQPAAAADGDELILGTQNAATSPTGVTVSGGPTTYGLGVLDDVGGEFAAAGALFALAQGGSFDVAIRAVAQGDGVGAIDARSEEGTAGFFINEATDAPALYGGSVGNVGVLGAGVKGQLGLTPETPAPIAFTGTRTGTLYMQAGQDEESFIDGTLWVAVEDGSPGTWRKLAGHDTAGALHILPAPRRVYDSRPGGLPTAVGPKIPLAPGVARTLDLKAASSGVPAGATGALVTVLLVNATAGAGNFTVWANDQPKPTANTLVWGGDAGRFTTQALTAVDSLARVKVDASLQTHVVIDVVGYYR